MASKGYKELYGAVKGKRYEWPDYVCTGQSPEEIDQVRRAYFAALSMCDAQLGRILDWLEQENRWKNTMLIVNTDHGFMLGEHGYWAKNYMPCYNEVVHTPLFIWDPRQPEAMGCARNSLVQTIDLPVTILDFFGIEPMADMCGKSLRPVIRGDTPIRKAGLFGTFGGHICCTDGRYVYMRAPRDTDERLFEYTLMPTHMMHFFSLEELKTMRCCNGFSFTKQLPVMKIETDSRFRCIDNRDLLFDLCDDPAQNYPMESDEITLIMENCMHQLMKENDAPSELYRRFGL